ncbi:alkylated DNA repair protein ALKBH8 homolog [Punica granatum]|uniref:Alkylated DNA repair protein ALKBH8 homolog n=1 Tax=Punica granatum TaxID=22663 RepID=A0A6P8DKB5_PUNGR|nr:alkylated DNA repair protein ALKBH8 homolog [Punica granatum]
MGLPRFARPKEGAAGVRSPNLFVANCGPAVGVSQDAVEAVFGRFGEVKGVYAADESGARVIVCYGEVSSAEAAMEALNGRPCAELNGRSLHIRYSVHQPASQVKADNSVPVSFDVSELNIPGLHLVHDFVSAEEERELLAAVDGRPWNGLAKRRVQHYGYEFCYDTRNVDTRKCLGELPSFLSYVLERISSFPGTDSSSSLDVDQLTVNEYPIGVGLSPHIDTHSAFEGFIFSLSLAGPCIMEFRRYSDGIWLDRNLPGAEVKDGSLDHSNYVRKAIYLPPRSMLLLSGEARYAWHHYIPHHKIDFVGEKVIKRSPRRVSFTFRKVRNGPCQCEFPQYCDSQR